VNFKFAQFRRIWPLWKFHLELNIKQNGSRGRGLGFNPVSGGGGSRPYRQGELQSAEIRRIFFALRWSYQQSFRIHFQETVQKWKWRRSL